MTKRIVHVAGTLLLLAAASASAGPIPFQVIGSSISVTFNNGAALGGYTSYSMAAPVSLDANQSFAFTFGKVFVPLSAGNGTGTLTIHLATPSASGVSDDASFSIFSFFIGLANVNWGNPVTFEYSYGGLTGGSFELDMFNLTNQGFVGGFDLRGRITNVTSPYIATITSTPTTAVQEPATLALLGAGLLALGLFRRRRRAFA